MKYLKLSFQNKLLEQQFQDQILKQAKESFLFYQSLFNAILMLDAIIKSNVTLTVLLSGFEMLQISTLMISQIWPNTQNYIKYYYYYLDFAFGFVQLIYSKDYLVKLEPHDIQIYMDILIQLFFLTQFRFNYIGATIMFIQFISIRIFLQISQGYSLVTIGYLLTGGYFPLLQYKQEKFRRKLFLKSKRNKQLEMLIEEFIDDQVGIIEKDEQNIRFKTLLLNKKLNQISDFSSFLKQVHIPQYKLKLQDYLYKSTKQKESFLCQYNNQNYFISFQAFTMKKKQMFIKIKLLDKEISKIVNYKQLYHYVIQTIKLQPYKRYSGKIFLIPFL